MRSTFLDPGALRIELSLQAAALAADGLGGHIQTWQEVATVFGLIEPVSQASRLGADQTLEENTHRITIRRRDHVLPGMRFVRLARLFEILTVHDPDESGRYLSCRVREAGQ
ncbi:phage head closure protein [Mesorhizobium sp. LHD-90]|uniref:phage head closure protein n=1 Tax=Mesorhizobium sp. LHD-90 TaxID=3071414 RepID=UPI0027DF1464|nr:phage head closure protein [Mesorhizobium sp. LHD-90]MDQ6436883.1 phage head closure protein [Mesorhizobium sp. LHD-90]